MRSARIVRAGRRRSVTAVAFLTLLVAAAFGATPASAIPPDALNDPLLQPIDPFAQTGQLLLEDPQAVLRVLGGAGAHRSQGSRAGIGCTGSAGRNPA